MASLRPADRAMGGLTCEGHEGGQQNKRYFLGGKGLLGICLGHQEGIGHRMEEGGVATKIRGRSGDNAFEKVQIQQDSPAHFSQSLDRWTCTLSSSN